MMELNNDELSVLNDILWSEIVQDAREPGRRDSSDQQVTLDLAGKVRSEAKKRNLWWVS